MTKFNPDNLSEEEYIRFRQRLATDRNLTNEQLELLRSSYNEETPKFSIKQLWYEIVDLWYKIDEDLPLFSLVLSLFALVLNILSIIL
jgi:hypothetical protein